MTGFEPQTFSIRIDRSTNWATTTAKIFLLLFEPSFLRKIIVIFVQLPTSNPSRLVKLNNLKIIKIHRHTKTRILTDTIVTLLRWKYPVKV